MRTLSCEDVALVNEDGVPKDWDQPDVGHGYSRHNKLKHYVVRLSVAGKQHCIGVAYSQERARRLYDLAVWKLAPKATRKLKPNDVEAFGFITQEAIDRECPRLNKIFKLVPALADTDESEQELRERVLSGRVKQVSTRGLAEYNSAILFLRGFRAEIMQQQRRSALRRLKLPFLPKLAQAGGLWNTLDENLRGLEGNLLELEQSLESQRAYYQKLATTLEPE